MATVERATARTVELIRRSYALALLVLIVVGLPFALLYRSEGATIGRYTPRYVYGVLAPLGVVILAVLVLALAPSPSRRALAATLGRLPGVLAAALAILVLPAAAIWALQVSDEYVSVLVLFVVPGVALMVWERGFDRAEVLLAGIPFLAAGILLFAVELPGFLGGGPLLVWGDESTFQSFFPRQPPFIGRGGRLRPSLSGRMRAPEYRLGARIVTNAAGFRNEEEFDGAPAPGGTRVLSLGDSFSTGFGADQDWFFGALLQARLREGRPARDVHVMNAEVSDPAYGLLYLQGFGMGYHPDVVLYGLSGNDVMQAEEFYGPDRLFRLGASGLLEANPAFDPAVESAWVRYRDFAWPTAGRDDTAAPRLRMKILTRLVRFRFFAGWAEAAAREGGLPVDMPGYAGELERADGRKRLIDGSANLGFFYTGRSEPVDRMYAAFFDLLRAMDATVRSRGARFVLVVYPQRYQVQPPDWEVLARRWSLTEADFDRTLANRRIAAFGAERDIEICDTLPSFQAAYQGRSLFLPAGDVHFNRHGHEVAAEAVARCLQGSGSQR